MRFAIIGHLINNQNINQVPNGWSHCNDLLITPRLNFMGTEGIGINILLTPEEMIELPRDKVHKEILKACLFAHNKLEADVIQLGGLTTSVTSGGIWVANRDELDCYINHGDSFTAAITCQNVLKSLKEKGRSSNKSVLAIIGAYGIIGEAVSKILVPQFKESILIGRRKEKLEELSTILNGNFVTNQNLDLIKRADVVVTATSHPTALLGSHQLKKDAIVVDVSQPPNLSAEVCELRSDITRIDGGFVDNPTDFDIPLMPNGKIFACIAEVIMQAMEDEKKNHVGSIEINHLHKTEKWAQKHGFILKSFTNFGRKIQL